MSIPYIPHLDPNTEITFEDAVRLLADSIAAQRKELARMADIEQKKITYILDNNRDDVSEASESVVEILGTIEKFRMLLSLENNQVRRQITALPPSPTAVQVGRTRPVLPDASAFSHGFSTPRLIAQPRETRRPCVNQPGLVGFARGVVTNQEDAVYGRNAALHAFIPGIDVADRSVRYTAGTGDSGIYFYASGRNVTIKNDNRHQVKTISSDSCRNELVISGEGTVRFRRSEMTDHFAMPECTAKAAFVLTVLSVECELRFRIQIAASDRCPAYDSGWVVARGSPSNLSLRLL